MKNGKCKIENVNEHEGSSIWDLPGWSFILRVDTFFVEVYFTQSMQGSREIL